LENCVNFLDGKRKPIKSSDRKSELKLYPYYGASGIIDYIDDYILDGRFILLSEDGANIIDRNYRVAFIAEGKIWVNNHAHVLLPNKNVNIVFLTEKLESLDYNIYNTGTTMPKLNQEVCRNILIRIPILEEQSKIGNLLAIINERIATQNKNNEDLKKLKSAMIDLFFHGNMTWQRCCIGDILKIGNGKDYKHLNSGNIPVYGTGGRMLSVSDWLYDGDSVCIGRKGTINQPMFLSGKFWTVDTLFYTYDFKNITPKFCYYLFNTINWLEYNEASGVPSLSKATIEKIKVKIPNMDKQIYICSVLDSVCNKIKFETKIVSNYNSQKSYLLQQMFI